MPMLATLQKENPNKNIWVLWFDQDSTPSDLAMKKSMEEDYKTQFQTYDADVHDKLPLRMKFLYPCCLHCGLEDRSQLATCKGCYLAHYCKAPGTCQKSDYARHKFFCRSVRGWILGQPYARIRPLFKYPGDTRPLRERSSMSAWSYRAYLEFLCFWEIKCIACFEGIPKGRPSWDSRYLAGKSLLRCALKCGTPQFSKPLTFRSIQQGLSVFIIHWADFLIHLSVSLRLVVWWFVSTS